MLQNGNSYNNADSFAMLFDEEWKRNEFTGKSNLSTDQKIKKIIENNKDHPFINSSRSEAFSIAKFRLRLLKLE